jgi:hypothetical protein
LSCATSIVIQDGQLHVYRDVYNKNTNTEETCARVRSDRYYFDTLSEEQKTQALNAVNAMSLSEEAVKRRLFNPNAVDKKALAAGRKAEAERQSKLRSQKIVIDLAC